MLGVGCWRRCTKQEQFDEEKSHRSPVGLSPLTTHVVYYEEIAPPVVLAGGRLAIRLHTERLGEKLTS
jgi:hypothetical protein